MNSLSRLCLLTGLIYLQSCGDGLIKHKDGDAGKSATVAHAKIPVPDATDNLIIKNEKDLVGYWLGYFDDDASRGTPEYDCKINISIDEINNGKVNGHTIIEGVFKPFTGSMEKTGSTNSFPSPVGRERV